MHLKEYLVINNIPQPVFAKNCGIGAKTLWCVINGSNPSLATAEKIVRASLGNVSFEELCAGIKNKTRKAPSSRTKKQTLPKSGSWKRKTQ